MHQLGRFSPSHVQVVCDVLGYTQKRIVILVLSNCFLATKLEAENGSGGEFLASILQAASLASQFHAIITQERALGGQSADCENPQTPPRKEDDGPVYNWGSRKLNTCIF